MLCSENDIAQWKADLKNIDADRKAASQNAQKYQFSKPVTWRDVKQKEAQYHPILQKFSAQEKENTEQMKETTSWKHKAESQKKNISKYLPEYNIISNMYLANHDSKTEVDKKKVEQELHNKYTKTHDYNALLSEFYDKDKEAHYQEKRAKEQQEHGKQKAEKLPPTIKNRETIIFDPTREVPDAIKKLDQKKKDAMKKYELRYKVEEQVKERDYEQQAKDQQLRLNRINDKKFTEHLDKGFDIITMNDYDKSQLKYVPKPNPTKWEKLKLTSNSSIQVQPNKSAIEKPSLTSVDLKKANSSEGSRFADNIRPAALNAWKESMRSASMASNDGVKSGTKFYESPEFSQTKEFKSSQQRSKEPAYNLADKYSQYCVPPQRVVDDFNTRTLPQIRVADNKLKFGLTTTVGFKKGETTM